MDPVVLAARAKHHNPKPRPSAENLTPFQEQLRKNPYALALATPVRECNLTKQRIPKYFLQGYSLLAHPDNGDPWWMPKDLAKRIDLRLDKHVARVTEEVGADKSVLEKQEIEDKFVKEEDDLELLGALEEAMTEDAAALETYFVNNPRTPGQTSQAVGPTIYTLSRKEFLRTMVKNRDIHKAFVDSQLLNNARSRELFAKAQFRGDIDRFLLELMRRRCVENLCRLLQLQRGYITGCKNWEDALAKTQIGVYLWTGSKGEGDAPGEFATVDVGPDGKKRKIPVHNLLVLLGEKKMGELREMAGQGGKTKGWNGIWENDLLAVRHKNMTVDVQMGLWKLQGYLAEYQQFNEVS